LFKQFAECISKDCKKVGLQRKFGGARLIPNCTPIADEPSVSNLTTGKTGDCGYLDDK
jgi:hypothetical protein